MNVERKIIKQGGGGHTIYLPKKWVDAQGLKAGESIQIEEKESQLILSSKDFKIPEKETTIQIKKKEFHTYRGILGGLYRAGYQRINVKFDDISIIPILEKVVSSLYGFEVFDIGKQSAIIKSVYVEPPTEIEPYAQKMIHIVNTMQEIIINDFNNKTFKSGDEIFQYRTNILKYRDLIVRTIVEKKLLGDEHFSFYQIAYSLWNVARNYNQLYNSINIKQEFLKENLSLLEQVANFVKGTFSNLHNQDTHNRFKEYDDLRKKLHKQLNNKKKVSFIVAQSLAILMAAHSADSSILLLNLNH